MANPTPHGFRFFRAGGVDQVQLRNGADVAALPQLDQKLWMALSLPTRGLEFDPRTADLIDTDKDGRIRPPELLAAIEWSKKTFKNLDVLLKPSYTVPLANIADPDVVAGAKRILTSLKKPDADSIALADVSDTAKIFAETTFNGDGVVPADAASDPATQKAIEDIIAAVGSTPDRSGKPGVDQARVDAFFEEAKTLDAWNKKLDSDASLAPLGAEGMAAAAASVREVKAKIDDYFARCAMVTFDPRSAGPLNRDEKDYAALAPTELSTSSPELAALPLAKIESGKSLSLRSGLNPAWQSRIVAMADKASGPLIQKAVALTQADWDNTQAKLSGYISWEASKPQTRVEKLGLPRLRELISTNAKAKIDTLITQDKALEKEVAQLEAVERLVRYQRDLFSMLTNSVNFADFYGKRGALFQAGTLYLDARSCDLCIEVMDVATHGALAGLSAAYLAYCELTRPNEPKKTIVAVFTDGDSDNLLAGRNGVFYDRKGRDWHATITKIVANPISIREAFWLPYKKLVRAIEDQIAKRAQSAEADSNAEVAAGAAAVANADKTAPKKEKAESPKLDLGTIALIGTAIGGISALMGGFLTALFGMGIWMPVGVAGVILLISGPSMLLAYLKLRQRNLGPLLDANGWAINTRAKLNVPFGAALTRVARLPAGSTRSLDDPFAEKKRPWRLYLTTFVLALLVYLWFIGRLDAYVPARIRNATVFPPKPVATAPVEPASPTK